MFALSLYSVSHKFTLALAAHKGKSKGKKISQQHITTCGNRGTVTYVRIIILEDSNMDKYIFDENNGLWYELIGDYYFPCLTVPTEKEQFVGIRGQRHRRYLKECRPALYDALLLSGKLNSYLADIDQRAEAMFSWLVEQMSKQEGITEQLKAECQMEWVQRMNNIRERSFEVVNQEIIFT